jgi:hypothetical protein
MKPSLYARHPTAVLRFEKISENPMRNDLDQWVSTTDAAFLTTLIVGFGTAILTDGKCEGVPHFSYGPLTP